MVRRGPADNQAGQAIQPASSVGSFARTELVGPDEPEPRRRSRGRGTGHGEDHGVPSPDSPWRPLCPGSLRLRPPSSGAPPWWSRLGRRPTGPTNPATMRSTTTWPMPTEPMPTEPRSPVATTSSACVVAGESMCRTGVGSTPGSRAGRTTRCCCSATAERCIAARYRYGPCRTPWTGHSPSIRRPGMTRLPSCVSLPLGTNPSRSGSLLSRGMSAGAAGNCNDSRTCSRDHLAGRPVGYNQSSRQ